MTVSKYFWGLNDAALKETKQALKDPTRPQFSQRMVTLLSRCDKPKELFQIVPKEIFIEHWPKVRSYWLKRDRQSNERDWWETIYEQLIDNENTTSHQGRQSPALFHKFGKTVREKRIEKGLSQQQLAHQTGLTQSVISHVEEGKKNITFFTLLRLCKALGIKTVEVG